MRQNGSNLNGHSGARPTARRDLGQLPSGQRRRRRKPGAMYLNHSRGFSDRSARIGNGRSPRRPSRLPYALIAVGCALVLFIAAVVGYVNRSVDIVLNGEQASVRVGSTLQNLIDDQGLTDTYDAGDLLAVDDSVLTRRGGEKLSVKVDGKRVKQGKWNSRELTGGEKVTVKDGRDTYEKHEVQVTTIEPKLKVEGTGAIEYVKTWGVRGRSEVWVGEQSGKTQDRGEVVPATDCVVECASVAPKGNEKYVALTFDEGPSGATKQVLQVLKEKGVTATFFLSGDAAEASPATAKAIVDAGCEIGSNSYSDDSLKGKDREAVRKQITKGTEAIKSATGVETMLLRAPYAAFDEQNLIDAMDLVSAVVSWNVDSGDWLLNGADEQVSTVLESVTPGNIVLFTDSDECSEQTLEALPQIIDGLVAKGYKIVTLSDLVKTDTSLSKKLTSLTKTSMPKNAVFPQLVEDNDTTD
ncbi:polysaccharide deacetylase family protein [Collinsella sp. SGI.095]|uniref:polysaccharide deacetylase family protein n=1 Tax=Collinsella sp. SGI.095 TaxID=3420553 RepID=UPI003D07614E